MASKKKSFILRLISFFTFFVVLFLSLTCLAYAAEPSLKFEPDKVTLGIGEQVDVDVFVDTAGNEVAGAGAKIEYNPQEIAVISVETADVFADYPSATFNNISGRAVISGIVSSAKNLYTGRGKFGTLTLQGVKEGISKVKFEFEPGSTTDSNIAVTYGSGDILKEVNELEVEVSQSVGTSIPTPSIPTSSEEAEEELVTEEEEKGFVEKLLDFLGIGSLAKKKIDPYAPITQQDPSRRSVPVQTSQKAQKAERLNFILIGTLVLLAIFIISVLLFVIKKKKKKKKEDSASVVQIDT